LSLLQIENRVIVVAVRSMHSGFPALLRLLVLRPMGFFQAHLVPFAALIALGTAVVVAAAVAIQRRQQGIRDADWPVVAKPFLTAREREWHRALISAFPDLHVFAQVSLSQLVDVRKGAPEAVALRNRFRQLVADVVLCSSSYEVQAVIEIDDASHGRSERREADHRKAKALGFAGIKLLRIPPGINPSRDTIRKYVTLGSEAGFESACPGPRTRAVHGSKP
jgi:hypothetical protein